VTKPADTKPADTKPAEPVSAETKLTTANTVVKSAPTPAQKSADQADAIKKLQQARAWLK